jgi:hypothetical protein
MIRLFDIFFSIFGLLFLLPLFFLISVIGFFNTGSPLFLQQRLGLNLKIFTLVKFRTMKLDTLSVGTHLADLSNVTRFGYFLRKSKLDEIPQLWNVLIGNMSLVGPRPCLLNQRKLIMERKKRGVFLVRPGITGLAQVNGIDMSTPTFLAKTDLRMIRQMNLFYYFYYILITFLTIFKKR